MKEVGTTMDGMSTSINVLTFHGFFFSGPIEARHLELMFTCLLLLQVFTYYYCYLGFVALAV
jgi:hypothetical protein